MLQEILRADALKMTVKKQSKNALAQTLKTHNTEGRFLPGMPA